MDRIVTSRAANKTGALVTGKGVHWTPTMSDENKGNWQDLPHPIVPLSPAVMCNPNWRDIPAGTRIGRVTVLGYAGRTNHGARWVVRCSCGLYGRQSARFLLSDAAKQAAMCSHCHYLERMKIGKVIPPKLRVAALAARLAAKQAELLA